MWTYWECIDTSEHIVVTKHPSVDAVANDESAIVHIVQPKKQLHCGQTLRNKHEVCC